MSIGIAEFLREFFNLQIFGNGSLNLGAPNAWKGKEKVLIEDLG